MTSRALPPVALTISFIDCINRGDLDGLGRLMSPDHRLEVLDESPVVGRETNIRAWRGYFEGFRNYVIYPRRISEQADTVAVLGHTTGSHLGLPDSDERRLTLIWLSHVADGAVKTWRLIEDTPENRRKFGLDDTPEGNSTSDNMMLDRQLALD